MKKYQLTVCAKSGMVLRLVIKIVILAAVYVLYPYNAVDITACHYSRCIIYLPLGYRPSSQALRVVKDLHKYCNIMHLKGTLYGGFIS